MLTLADIIEALCGTRPPEAQTVITLAVIDSREAIPGALFVAIPGQQVDGHDYVGNAFQNGANLALIEHPIAADFPVLDLRTGFDSDALAGLEFPFCILVGNTLTALQTVARFYRRKMDVRVVGITGSVGKSTTKELIAEVLGQRYPTLKSPGNLNNEIGLPLIMLQLTHGHERAVLEMGFYVPGEIEFLCDIALPQVGVVTNVGLVHAERAGSQEVIAQGKAELVRALPTDGVAVLNYDDEWVRGMAGQTQARVLFYGLDPQADLWADEIEGLGLDGIRFSLHYQGETLHLKVPMLGQHSVHTVLRATAVGLVEGLDWGEILSGLRFGQTQLRLVAVRAVSGALLLDDTYNASPQSTLAALNLLHELDGRKVAVLGDMLELGQYERQGHEMVGYRCAEVADELITIGQRARTIAETARSAGMPASKVTEMDSPDEATALLRTHLSANDVVLVKGSLGMQMRNIVPSLEAQEA